MMPLHTLLILTALLASRTPRAISTGNVALNKPARQSSDHSPASRAVDGNTNPQFPGGSCSHTLSQNDPWWSVDLLVPYKVTNVSVTNRLDCCSERLNGAEIRIGNSPVWSYNPRCVRISSIPAGTTSTLQCGGMEGRYVIVFIPGEQRVLTLCEVEVYSSSKDFNRLTGLKAFQSSLWANFDVSTISRSIDGVRLTSLGYCTCTAQEQNPWLRVELQVLYRVTAVTLTNRGDCCPDRLTGAEIRVGNSLDNNGNNNPRCAVVSTVPAGASFTYFCIGMLGQYVNILNPGTSRFITLSEVDVFGASAEDVALNGTASQSSDWDPAFSQAKNAIDGSTSSSYNSGSCSHTLVETNPWWRVDLGSVYKVSAVTVTNRDQTPNSLIGADICIGNNLDNNCSTSSRCAIIDVAPAGLPHTFFCDQLEGQYVTIFNPGMGKYICLCEVQVYGVPTGILNTTTATPTISTISPAPPPPTRPPPTPSASLVLLGGRNVTVVGMRLCWSDALFYCRDHYGDLLSLRSQEEQKEVEGLLASVGFPLTPHLWMGLRRTLMEYNWFWMTGDFMTFSQWESGSYPMYAHICGGVANGVNFLWSDIDCGVYLNFLCYSGSNDGVQRVDFYSTLRDQDL